MSRGVIFQKHVPYFTKSVSNSSILFSFSSFVLRLQRNGNRNRRAIYFRAANTSRRTVQGGENQHRDTAERMIGRPIDRDHERCTVPSLPRGRDPCLCWPAVGVALSQALLSANSMKSAIARNCLELAQSNHPPFPVRVRVYINR